MLALKLAYELQLISWLPGNWGLVGEPSRKMKVPPVQPTPLPPTPPSTGFSRIYQGKDGGSVSILIVDDCSDTRVTLRLLLESRGYTDIRTAGSGPEALALLGVDGPTEWAAKVEVVLMDVGMPDMDG